MKNLFIAEVTIQKQNVKEMHLPGYYFHFRYLFWLSWKTIL